VSRRKRSGAERPGRSADAPAAGEPSGWAPPPVAPNRKPPRLPFPAQVAVLVAVFAVVTLIAELAGAANLGVSLGIGVIAFSIALVAMIVEN
jgi:hypothetical protein